MSAKSSVQSISAPPWWRTMKSKQLVHIDGSARLRFADHLASAALRHRQTGLRQSAVRTIGDPPEDSADAPLHGVAPCQAPAENAASWRSDPAGEGISSRRYAGTQPQAPPPLLAISTRFLDTVAVVVPRADPARR